MTYTEEDAKRAAVVRRRIAAFSEARKPLAFMADANDLSIDGEIGSDDGEISARMVKATLAMADRSRQLTVRIHSQGGAVFEGFAIYDAIKSYDGPKRCVVESCAFSAASIIVAAFNRGEVSITPNGFLMVHNADYETEGTTPEQKLLLRDLGQRMAGIYASRTGKSRSQIEAMMNRETFLSAEEAIAFGLVDRIQGATAKPMRISAKARKPQPSALSRWKIAVDACGNVSAANKQNPGLRLAMLAEVNKR